MHVRPQAATSVKMGSSCPDCSNATYTQQNCSLHQIYFQTPLIQPYWHDMMSMQSPSVIPAPKGRHPLAKYIIKLAKKFPGFRQFPLIFKFPET
jgi:hypothetical protein